MRNTEKSCVKTKRVLPTEIDAPVGCELRSIERLICRKDKLD